MRVAVLAVLLLIGLPLSSGAAALTGKRSSKMKAIQTERAIAAEARSRLLRIEICRGCGVSNEGPRTHRIRPSRRSIRQVRAGGTTISGSVSPLPLTTRAEAQVQSLSRQMAEQQQLRQFQQQTQFEINQLRNEVHRDYLFR
jgi:hypothetical protein